MMRAGEQGSECESLLEELVGGRGSELVSMHFKIALTVKQFTIDGQGFANPGRDSRSRITKTPKVAESGHEK